MSVEEFALRTHTYGIESQQNTLQHLGSIKLTFTLIKRLIFRFHERIQVRQDRVIVGSQSSEVRLICDVPFGIQLLEHDLDHINLPVCKIFIGPEEIFEKTDMLR